jgi:uracil phosphoribosyltransferase
MLHVLSDQNSIANEFLRELRDKKIQTDRLRFRTNLARLGAIMAYEISRVLAYQHSNVETPMGVKVISTLREHPILLTILRAGIPFFEGFQEVFDHSDSGFIGAYRQEGANDITIKLEYLATSDLNDLMVILIDPMLATGRSVIDVVNAVMRNGRPKHIHLASVIAAPEGIAYLKENLELPHTIWTFAVDQKLNDQFYIIPGLGDAGDLSYGEKI